MSDSLASLPQAVARLAGSGHAVDWIDGLVPFARIDPARLAAADAILTGRVMRIDAAALDLAPRARVIALHTSGTDNVDLAAAAARGIAVTCVKGVNGEACAEFSIGLMLALVRQIPRGDAALRAGRWAADTQGSMGLAGATLGLVGLGQIGRAAARRAAAFGMRILCATRTPDPGFAAAHAIDYADLDTLLAESDVVSLYAALTPETRGMIGAREIARMKPGAYLVNVARGELVDEAALHAALAEKRIAGAALDVFEAEPLTESPLMALPNVILTPHMAGLTHGAKSAAAVLAVENALAVLAGRVPPNLVPIGVHA